MKYVGSKRRLAKHILPIMLQFRDENQWWVEPFVGGGNMIERVGGLRIGSDANRYAIEALISIRDHLDELPKSDKEFTEDDYRALKEDDSYPHKGYAGFAFSFAAKWMGGWRRDSKGTDSVAQSYRSAQKQSPLLQDVILKCCDYRDLWIPDESVIYCDPPYLGSQGYLDDIDHNEFWKWCQWQSDIGHTVFISEYAAPLGFRCVWEKPVYNSLDLDTGSKGAVERLFVPDNNRKTYPLYPVRGELI